MVQVAVHNIQGEVIGKMKLSDDVFGMTPNLAVVHQALVRQLANARQGTANTKTRAEVSGGGRKPFRQKGTGRARRGSQSSPLLRGGGVTFGPKPRSYRQALPKKMRHLAVRSVLSAKVADGEITVVDELALSEPRTKDMANILKSLGIINSVLIVTEETNSHIYKSARNLENTKTLTADMINVADLLSYKVMLITKKAVQQIENMFKPRQRKLVEV